MEPPNEKWRRGAPNVHRNPEQVADRIASELEQIPAPTSVATLAIASRAAFAAIERELGAVGVAIGRRWPPVRLEEAEGVTSAAGAWRVDRFGSGDPTTIETQAERDAYDQLARSMASSLKAEPADIDLWQQLLIHRRQIYGILALARVRSRTGPISDADRQVVVALEDRLAAILAHWYDVARQGPDHGWYQGDMPDEWPDTEPHLWPVRGERGPTV